jgi:transcriptional regulator with XRE-family HTH domain
MTVMRGGESGQRICAGCRVTRLSRYNPDVLCGSCMRSARTPPQGGGADRSGDGQVPGWVWESPLLSAAVTRMDLGAVMVICRIAAGLSQLQFAHILGCSQATIWRIETGKRQSLYDIRELLRFADAIGMPRRVLLPLILGDQADHDDFLAGWREAMNPAMPSVAPVHDYWLGGDRNFVAEQ